MKKLTLLFIAMLICSVAFCDEAWSSASRFGYEPDNTDSICGFRVVLVQ